MMTTTLNTIDTINKIENIHTINKMENIDKMQLNQTIMNIGKIDMKVDFSLALIVETFWKRFLETNITARILYLNDSFDCMLSSPTKLEKSLHILYSNYFEPIFIHFVGQYVDDLYTKRKIIFQSCNQLITIEKNCMEFRIVMDGYQTNQVMDKNIVEYIILNLDKIKTY
jgi:hypothetical protein